jgi:hypothetical protein
MAEVSRNRLEAAFLAVFAIGFIGGFVGGLVVTWLT